MIGISSEIVIDHVTIAGADLSVLEAAFQDAGIDPEYGGEHDGLPTEMSIVGFDDGTYIELIAKTTPSETAAFWDREMDTNAGPCAWAIRSTDLSRDISLLRERGIAVDGPHAFSRDRPDGSTSEWTLAFLGDGDPGTRLPFLIEDKTPRSRRVEPTPSATSAGLAGVETVVIAVDDLDAASAVFERAFDHPRPEFITVNTGPFAGRHAEFPALSVVLVTQEHQTDRLAERLRVVGDGPCAFVLATSDDDVARERFRTSQVCPLGSQDVAVIDPNQVGDIAYLCLIPS